MGCFKCDLKPGHTEASVAYHSLDFEGDEALHKHVQLKHL